MNACIKIVCIVLLGWFSLHLCFTLVDGVWDELGTADVCIVLGNKVDLNGKPSNRLKARLDKTVELYRRGFFQTVIVSGGVGREGYDEAEVMKKYLLDHQVPTERIIVDSKGNNTYLTARNAKAFCQKQKFNSALIVTQFYHISRTKLAFAKVGFKDVSSAHADFFELRDVYSLIREVPAFYKYLALHQE